MPVFLPDPSETATPLLRTLPAGGTLWRLHSRALAPADFNPSVPPPMGGGRFDCTDGTWPYLYAGADTVAAVAETILRDRPHTAQPYIIPAAKLRDRNISAITTTQDLLVVVLHGAGLAAVGQHDNWLTSCGPNDYFETRIWADQIRTWAPTACGLEWRARHDNDRFAYIFFEDRCAAGAINEVVDKSYPIDARGRGFLYVQRACTKHNATASLPP